MISNAKPSFFEYALLSFLILWSGGGFTYALFPHWMLYALPLIGVVFIHKQFRFSSSDWMLLALLSGVIVLQFFKFNGAPITIISPIMVICVCMMSAHLLRDNFTTTFVNIIYFFAFASLVLWLINLLPSGHAAIDNFARGIPQLGWQNLTELETNSTNNPRSVYLFTISDGDSTVQRNPGPFWEPGRFTIYLTLALAINLFHNNQKFSSLKNIILLCANITTFSTTGYSTMAVLLFLFALGTQRFSHFQKVVMVVLLAVVAGCVWQFDFMADKIAEQANQVDITYSRFGAVFYHWTQIIESPLIGYGPFLSMSIADLAVSPNGLTDLVRYYGIPIAFLLYALLYKGTTAYIGNNVLFVRIGVFVSILVLCFSQTITYSPFFYLLYCFGINNCQYETN